MLFWFLAAIITAVSVAGLVFPLRDRARASTLVEGDDLGSQVGNSADVAVYRDQLAEIEADLNRGLIADADAEAARIEISRRLLNAADQATSEAAFRPAAETQRLGRTANFAALASAILIPLSAIGLYASVGAPGIPDVQRAARLAVPIDQLPLTEILARVEARLKEVPDDGRGWDLIAPLYLRQARFSEAQASFEKSIEYLGPTPTRLLGLANASIGAARGRVSDATFRLLNDLAKSVPDAAQVRFWLAVGHEQRLEFEAARTSYNDVLRLAASDDELRQAAAERMAALPAEKAGKPVPAPLKDNAPLAAPGEAGPQQREMIEGMVAALDTRLRDEGGDADEWQRLIRSYVVLGQPAKAQAALQRAVAALKDTPDVVLQIKAFAQTMNVTLATAPTAPSAKGEAAQ